MRSVPLVVYSDYVCPWCYMVYTSLEAAAKEVPVEVEWRAFELRPRESLDQMDPEAEAEKKRQIEAFWPRVEQMAKDVYGLTNIKRGRWGVDTRAAHIGAKIAREAGREDEYHRRVFAAHWIEEKDIGNPQTLAEIAAQSGIDAQAFEAALGSQQMVDEVTAEAAEAHRLGIRGVPALIIDRRYLLSGAQPKESLVRILSQYARTGEIANS